MWIQPASVFMVLTSQDRARGSLDSTRRTTSRSRQRLTINYGLRFDILTPLVEANDYYSMVDTTKPNPAAGNLPGVYVFAGHDGVGSRIAPADKNSNNLGPRLGVAYSLNDKTVLRSAYGISYFQTGAYGGGNNVNQNDAYWPTSTTASPDDLTGAYTFSQGFPARDLVIPPLITPALGVGTGFVNYWHPTAGRAGRSQNFSAGIQRALGRSMSIDVAYVGSRGDHLPVRVDINQLDPKFLSLGSLLTRNIRDPLVVAAGYTPPYAGFNGSLAQALRPFPQFPNMFPGGRNSDTRGTSTYDALQVKFDKRYSNGLYATVAYTWSDTMTNAPNNFVNNAPMHRNVYDLEMSQARPSTYRPHTSAVGFLYELPVGTGKRFLDNSSVLAKIIGGWQLSGILRYTSGPTLGVSATQANPVYRGGATAEGIGGSTAIPQTADIVSGSADEAGDQGFRSANGSLPEHRGIRPADGSLRLIDGHDRRVARVCLAERGPGPFEDSQYAGPLDASNSRGDVQRVESCGIREPGEQHREPGNIRQNHQPGQHASKHADCIEDDILMRTGFSSSPPPGRFRNDWLRAGAARESGRRPRLVRGSARPGGNAPAARLRIGSGPGVAAAPHGGRVSSWLAGGCVARELPAGHVSRGGPQG